MSESSSAVLELNDADAEDTECCSVTDDGDGAPLIMERGCDIAVKVDAPMKQLSTLETFVTYRVRCVCARWPTPPYVRRRYNHFKVLHKRLVLAHPLLAPPPLPPLHSARQQLDRYSPAFVALRTVALNAFLDRVAKHPILTHSEDFRIFLTTPDEDIDKVFKNENNAMNLWGLSSALYSGGNSEAKPTGGARVKDPEFTSSSEYLLSLQQKLTTLCGLTSKLYKGSTSLGNELMGMKRACDSWSTQARGTTARAAAGLGVGAAAAGQANATQRPPLRALAALPALAAYAAAHHEKIRQRDAMHAAHVAGNNADDLHNRLEQASEALRAELSDWMPKTHAEVKSILLEMADRQVSIHTQTLLGWERALRLSNEVNAEELFKTVSKTAVQNLSPSKCRVVSPETDNFDDIDVYSDDDGRIDLDRSDLERSDNLDLDRMYSRGSDNMDRRGSDNLDWTDRRGSDNLDRRLSDNLDQKARLGSDDLDQRSESLEGDRRTSVEIHGQSDNLNQGSDNLDQSSINLNRATDNLNHDANFQRNVSDITSFLIHSFTRNSDGELSADSSNNMLNRDFDSDGRLTYIKEESEYTDSRESVDKSSIIDPLLNHGRSTNQIDTSSESSTSNFPSDSTLDELIKREYKTVNDNHDRNKMTDPLLNRGGTSYDSISNLPSDSQLNIASNLSGSQMDVLTEKSDYKSDKKDCDSLNQSDKRDCDSLNQSFGTLIHNDASYATKSDKKYVNQNPKLSDDTNRDYDSLNQSSDTMTHSSVNESIREYDSLNQMSGTVIGHDMNHGDILNRGSDSFTSEVANHSLTNRDFDSLNDSVIHDMTIQSGSLDSARTVMTKTDPKTSDMKNHVENGLESKSSTFTDPLQDFSDIDLSS